MTNMKRCGALLICTLIVLAGCRKEKDEIAPTIFFDLPFMGNSYQFGEIIPIKARISDDKKIDFIRITVSDASGNEYLQVLNLTSSSNEKTVETLLEHNDRYLTSGVYYVKISAGDGVNEFTAFREIYLHELPVALDKVYLVKQPSSTDFEVDSLGVDGEIYPLYFVAGRYAKGELDSRSHKFCFAETAFGSINIIDMEDGVVNSSNSLPSSAEDGFYNCVVHDPFKHSVYFGGNESQIRECTSFASLNIQFLIPGDFIAEHFALNEDYLFVHARNIQSTQQNITVFHRETGAFLQSLALDNSIEVIGLQSLENNEQVLVIANEDGASHLFKYNNATNAFNELFTMYDQSQCLYSCSGKDGRFYIAHQNGIVQYNSDLEMISSGMSISPVTMKYEPVNDRLYVMTGGILYTLNSSADTEIISYVIPNCRDVLFQYNK